MCPAYDLTFSSGPSGEHSTMMMGEGKNPTKNHFLKMAAISHIKQEQALEIIHQVSHAIEKWEFFAEEVGVSRAQTKNIMKFLKDIRKKVELT